MSLLKKSGISDLPLVGGLLGGGPDLKVTPLDPATQRLINEGVNRAVGETPEQISAQITDRVDRAVSRGTPTDEALSQESTRTGQDPYMLQAIRNRFSQGTAKDMQRFKNQSDVQAKLLKGERMANISNSALAAKQVQTNNFAALSQAFQQNELARAQVISNFIGLGSQMHTASVAGAGFPGRTARAAAGQQNMFNTQNMIGGNSNPFGMEAGYGSFDGL